MTSTIILVGGVELKKALTYSLLFAVVILGALAVVRHLMLFANTMHALP
jgi:hypothetical protein